MTTETVISIVLLVITVACVTLSAIINRRTLKRLDDNFEKLKKLKGWK